MGSTQDLPPSQICSIAMATQVIEGPSLLYALQLIHSNRPSEESVLIGCHARRTLPTAVASMWLPASGPGMASMGRISAGST